MYFMLNFNYNRFNIYTLKISTIATVEIFLNDSEDKFEKLLQKVEGKTWQKIK